MISCWLHIYHVFLHIDPPRPTTTNITFFAPINDGTDKVGEIFSQKEQAQWIKVKADKDGYFMLKYGESEKFLTVGPSGVGFEIKGNIDASMNISIILCNESNILDVFRSSQWIEANWKHFRDNVYRYIILFVFLKRTLPIEYFWQWCGAQVFRWPKNTHF